MTTSRQAIRVQLQQLLTEAINGHDEAKANALIQPGNPLAADLTQPDPEHGSALNHALAVNFNTFVNSLWTRLESMELDAIKINLSRANNQLKTCFHHVTASGNIDLLKKFLEHTNDINVFSPDKKGNTPLHLAADYANIEAMKCLLEYAKKRNQTELDKLNMNQQSPLQLACRPSKGTLSIELIAYLIEQNADMTLRDLEKRTALSLISELSKEDQDKLFIALKTKDLAKRNAQIEARKSSGNNAPYISTEMGLVDTFLYHYRQTILQHPTDEKISYYLSFVEKHNIGAYILSLIEFKPPTAETASIRSQILKQGSINPAALSNLSDEEKYISVQTNLYGKLVINARTLLIMNNMYADLMIQDKVDDLPTLNEKAIRELDRADKPHPLYVDHFIDLGNALYGISSPIKTALPTAQLLIDDLEKIMALINEMTLYISHLEDRRKGWKHNKKVAQFVTGLLILGVWIGAEASAGIVYSLTNKKMKSLQCPDEADWRYYRYNQGSKCSNLREKSDSTAMFLFIFGLVGALGMFTAGALLVAILSAALTIAINNIRINQDEWKDLIDDKLRDEIFLTLVDLEQRDTEKRSNHQASYLPVTQNNLRAMEAHLAILATSKLPIQDVITAVGLLRNDLQKLQAEMRASNKPFSLFSRKAAEDTRIVILDETEFSQEESNSVEIEEIGEENHPLASSSYSWA